MRTLTMLGLAFFLVACGGSSGDDDDDDVGDDDGDDDDSVTGDSFEITTPGVVVAPGDERTHCYYTTVPVDRDVGVSRWTSTMSLGSHHMIVYALPSSDGHPEGIEEDCNVISGTSIPAWTYSAQTPTSDFPMPEGVGFSLEAEQKIVIEMHYLNASTDPLTASVTLTGEIYAEDETYEPAAAFITYNSEISIDPLDTGEAGGECEVPDGARFFAMSTHAHRRATRTEVMDGGDMVFESDDWEHPGAVTWDEEPFFEFASGALTYGCEYLNDLDMEVVDGPSAVTNEMCMAVGYFFPAERRVLCINDTILPL
jgi:hypothetical protein